MLHILFIFFILSSYECNLRAFLIAVDLERPIDEETDLIIKGQKMWLPTGTPFLDFYKYSPFAVQRILGWDADRNNYMLTYDHQGLIPIELEMRMLKEGMPR